MEAGHCLAECPTLIFVIGYLCKIGREVFPVVCLVKRGRKIPLHQQPTITQLYAMKGFIAASKYGKYNWDSWVCHRPKHEDSVLEHLVRGGKLLKEDLNGNLVLYGSLRLDCPYYIMTLTRGELDSLASELEAPDNDSVFTFDVFMFTCFLRFSPLLCSVIDCDVNYGKYIYVRSFVFVESISSFLRRDLRLYKIDILKKRLYVYGELLDIKSVFMIDQIRRESTTSDLIFSVSRLAIEDVVFMYMQETGVMPQSGKEYAVSKYLRKETRVATSQEKVRRKLEDIKKVDQGSKRKKNVRSLKKKARHMKIEKHSGEESNMQQMVDRVLKKLNIPTDKSKAEMAVELLEQLLICGYGIYKKSTLITILGILTTFYKGSISIDIFRTLKEFFLKEKDFSNLTLEGLLSLCKSALTHWESFANNQYASSFLTFCSMVWTTFVSPTIGMELLSSSTYGIFSTKVFSFFRRNDIFGGFLKTCTYLLNAIDVFVRTGTLKGFIYTVESIDELGDEFQVIRSNFTLYRTGDLDFIVGLKHYKFLESLDSFIAKATELVNALNPTDSRAVKDWLKEAGRMKVECQTIEAHTKTRIAPFCLRLFSGSGINKSHLMKAIVVQILKYNNIECGDEFIYYLNDQDKYVSSWKNYTTAIMCDDAANAHPDKIELCLGNFILKASNNQPHNLLSAGVEGKGAQFNRALLMMFSANNPMMNCDVDSQYPSSVDRRIHYSIGASVRREYRKTDADGNVSTMIDYSKMSEEVKNSVVPDAWLFTLYKTDIQDRQDMASNLKLNYTDPIPKVRDSNFKWTKVHDNLNFGELISFLCDESQKHYEVQKNQVLRASERLDKAEYCSDCKLMSEWCRCKYNTTIPDSWLKLDSVEEGKEEDEEKAEISKQAGREIMLMKDFIEGIRKLVATNHIDSLKDAVTMTYLGCDATMTIMEVLETHFSSFISELITKVIVKAVNFFSSNFTELSDFIPRNIEGTELGAYLHSKRPIVPLLACGDRAVWNVLYTSLQCLGLLAPEAREGILVDLDAMRSGNNRHCCTELYIKAKDRYAKKSRKRIEDGYDYQYGVGKTLSDDQRRKKYQEVDDKSCGSERNYGRNILRDDIIGPGVIALIIFKMLPSYLRNFSKLYSLQEVGMQSGINLSVEDVKRKDLDKKESWYATRAEKIFDGPLTTARVTRSELNNTLSKNVLYVRVGSYVTNALMVVTNVILVPKHFVDEHLGSVFEFYRKSVLSSSVPGNAVFSHVIDTSNIVQVASLDLYAVNVSNTGGVRDIRHHFPNAPDTVSSGATIIFRKAGGELKECKASHVHFDPESFNDSEEFARNPSVSFLGHRYLTDSFKGLCGSPVISDSTKFSHIIGIHLGGNAQRRVGVSAFVSSDDLNLAVAKLNVGMIVKQGGFNLVAYKKDLFEPGYHIKSPVFDVADDLKNLRVVGRCSVRGTVKPVVVQTMISEKVASVFKHGCTWVAPPIFGLDGNDKNYANRLFLSNYLKQGIGPSPLLIQKASADYRRQIFDSLEEDKVRWREEIRPLTDDEVVNGIPGKRYVGGMKMSSSMGKHLSGSKSKYAQQDREGQWVFDATVMEDFRSRWNKMENLQRSWECVYATPKVEPTLKTKADLGKVRTFFAVDTGTQMCLRKAWLTHTRFFCTQRATSECAVGINPHSLDWHNLVTHFNEFKGNNFIAMDAANFDLGVTPQILIEAINILIDISKWTGNYSSGDIRAMYTLREELVNSIIDMNGDLIQAIGILLSGVNVTSILGSIVNALYLRIGTLEILRDPNKFVKTPFSSIVKAQFFGDDLIGKVRKGYEILNVTNFIQALGRYGVRFTNCFKDDRSVRFLKFEELEFLKRTFVYEKEFRCYVAPLNKKSIYKSLSCVLPTKHMSLQALVAQNIDGALSEMKFHGRREFEKFRKHITEIAIEADIAHLCLLLDVSFDDHLQTWRDANSGLEITQLNTSGILRKLTHSTREFWNTTQAWFG